MPDPSDVGQNVRRLRERQRWSQGELARRSGLSQAFLSRLEGGERQGVGNRTLVALSRALGCRVDDLLQEAVKEGQRTSGTDGAADER